MKCPRCLTGVDDDHDGDCGFCARLSDSQLLEYFRNWLKRETA